MRTAWPHLRSPSTRNAILRAAAREHRWFLVVLSLGAALRLVTMLGYRPALWFPDSYTYVVTALRPRPDLVRPAGYSMFLRLLEPFHAFGVVVAVQHLLGLAMGVLVYATVLRRGGRAWAATLATAPVLLDAYQIELEHLLVSDTLFAFLIVATICTLLGTPTWRGTCAAGALLGAATLTRTVGLPLVVVVAAWLLLRRSGPRRPGAGTADRREVTSVSPVRRLLSHSGWAGARLAVVLVVVALVPIAGYAAWFSATYHRFGIVGSNGVFLYARTMSFADCGVMRPPPDLAVLCDGRPPSRRPPSQEFVWAPDAPLVALPGITFTKETDRLAGRFAFLALRSQPVDYAVSVLSELARSFTWGRPVYPDQEIYDYYEFPARTPAPPGRYPAMVGADLAVRYEQGPIGTRIVEPFAGWMRAYQDVARLPGTALLAILLLPPAVAVASTWRSRRAAHPSEGNRDAVQPLEGNRSAVQPLEGNRSAVQQSGPRTVPSLRSGARRWGAPSWALPWVASVSLLVIPAATAEFDYRYVLPAVPLACLAAALLTARQADRSETS
nr:phospholipid carrier-dependent glycosyltransferase [Sphaerisporangium perillae]